MALAILELVALNQATVQFSIDTGTSRYYKLKIGRSVEHKTGIDWVNEVYFSSPLSTNEADGGLLNSTKLISIPITRFDRGNAYVQLFSFKTPEGKSPAFSRVVKIPMGAGLQSSDDFVPSLSSSMDMNTNTSFRTPRTIPCDTYKERYSQQASLEDILGEIMKVAGPVVLNLLGGSQNKNGQTAPSAPTGQAANLLTTILNTILGSITGTGAAISSTKSLGVPSVQTNRFLNGRNTELSKPFIFGIDDALLGALVGPALQVLPQLMNAANQQRLQMKQTNNKLVTDILSDVNQRMMLEQLLQHQAPPAIAQTGNPAVDFNTIIQMLQQAAAAAPTQPAPVAPVPAAAIAKSLSDDALNSSIVSSKTIVSFVTADPILWNGTPKIVFAKNRDIQLNVRLTVAEPIPKTSLPKAILKITFKDGCDQSVCLEKTIKQKNILANSVLTVPILRDELSHLPVNKPLVMLAEMRWLSSKSGKEYKAIGSSEIVLVNSYFLKEQGKEILPEQELTDMKRFRPYWNKVWEAPLLDEAGKKGDGRKKYIWELNVNAKYSILLSAEHDSNGLMQTKILRAPVDNDSLTETTEGRMKAGIELSIAELNKLLSLWNAQTALGPDKLEAFSTDIFAKNNANEFQYNFKLKGKANERGMIWVIPVFKLFDFTLNTIQGTDDSGQVNSVGEEKVQFPLPVSARVIGLKSQ